MFLITGLIWLQLAQRLWIFYLFAAIHGFAHGGVFALVSPLVAWLFGTKSHGLILGIVIFSGTVGGSVGPLVAGHIFDITASYRTAFLLLLSLAIAGFALILSSGSAERKVR